MSKANSQDAAVPGWEERFAEFQEPNMLQVNIDVEMKHWLSLTESEKGRLTLKLQMVERHAARLALNMIKGTLKYGDRDMTWTDAEWAAFEEDEWFDQINYRLLREASAQQHDY